MEELSNGKYTRHHEQQRQNLLRAAENLALERGIDAFTMKDIAEESGASRATLYRFFRTKDEMMWEIHRAYSRELGLLLSGFQGNTCERFEKYAEIMMEMYRRDRRSVLFLNIFFRDYARHTSKPVLSQTPPDQYRSGSTVQFLTRDFFDGSVRDDLEPVETAVSFSYGVMGILFFAAKAHDSVEEKYGIASQTVVRRCVQALLNDIRARQAAPSETAVGA